jgi:uncharacterized protein YigE (DUF2233 family)
MSNKFAILLLAFVLLTAWSTPFPVRGSADPNMLSYMVDPGDLSFYWKDDSGHILGSIQHLKDYLSGKHKKLIFAMNGGMFKTGNAPVGLFIQEQTIISPLDTSSGNGNFYLKPNGVFYITKDNKAMICQTEDFESTGQIRLATQSGPLLLSNSTIHPAFKMGSANVNIRNGVGILPNNKVVFAMSKEAMNFYDFAGYFKNLGCKNALYLDGFVSRTYLPEKNWIQTDGNFGVIIGVAVAEKL